MPFIFWILLIIPLAVGAWLAIAMLLTLGFEAFYRADKGREPSDQLRERVFIRFALAVAALAALVLVVLLVLAALGR